MLKASFDPRVRRDRVARWVRWVPARLASQLALATCGLVTPLAASPQQRNLEAVQITLPGGAREQLYEQSHALVIGASAYRNGWSVLPAVPGDVREVASALQLHGFKVTTLADPTRDQLDAALRRFVQQHGDRPGNRLLVYFAGHGHTLTTRAGVRLGYIVPVDAPNPQVDPAGFRANAIGMDSIEALAKQMDARHALFLFDSCFSGTIFRTRAGVPDDISDKTAKPVRQFITAGDEHQTVPDESHFRRELVAALREGTADLNRDGYITASELGMHLEREVTNYTRRAQTPRFGKIINPELDKGDFVFVSPRGSLAAARLTTADEVEQQLWEQIRNSRDVRDFAEYLRHYPAGRYAALAERQVRQLSAVSAEAPRPRPAPDVGPALPMPVVRPYYERSELVQAQDDFIALRSISRVREVLPSVRINVTVFRRIGLLTGNVQSEAERTRVVQEVERTEHLRGVLNMLKVAPNQSLQQAFQDGRLGGLVKQQLTAADHRKAGSIKIVAENNEIFLLGAVTAAHADWATELARRVEGVARVHKVFEIMAEAEIQALIAEGATR